MPPSTHIFLWVLFSFFPRMYGTVTIFLSLSWKNLHMSVSCRQLVFQVMVIYGVMVVKITTYIFWIFFFLQHLTSTDINCCCNYLDHLKILLFKTNNSNTCSYDHIGDVMWTSGFFTHVREETWHLLLGNTYIQSDGKFLDFTWMCIHRGRWQELGRNTPKQLY